MSARMGALALLTLFAILALPTHALATFSIVARDPDTGEIGVAVQSHYFAVGPIVPWAEPGVGAVATQSLVEVSYGPKGLELMRNGKSAEDALKELLDRDDHADVRQVAMIDVHGNVANHTGKRCIADAGDKKGENYSCQANLMANDKIWGAMAQAFETSKGDLAERLLRALEAGQAAGGDIRGQQSAAIVIVKGKRSNQPWADRVLDLRGAGIDRTVQPDTELGSVGVDQEDLTGPDPVVDPRLVADRGNGDAASLLGLVPERERRAGVGKQRRPSWRSSDPGAQVELVAGWGPGGPAFPLQLSS